MPVLSETKRLHLPFLDGVRGIAAVYVLLHHAFLVTLKPLWPDPQGMARLAGIAFDMGHFAVGVFIVLSGFSLMLPVVLSDGVLQGGARQFFRKRARRILPPYYLCLVASMLLIYVVPEANKYRFADQITWPGFVTHILLIHDFWPETSNKINPVLWSIAVEWRIYLIFPWLVWLWKKRGPVITTGLWVALSLTIFLVLQACHVRQASTPTGICPQYLALFALGTLAAGIAFSKDAGLTRLREGIRWDIATLFCFGLLLVSLKFPAFWGDRSIFFNDLYVGLFTSSVFIHFSKCPTSRIGRLLGKPLVARLGTRAYSIYLMHMPLQVVLLNYLFAFLPLSPLWKGIAFMTVGTLIVLAGCSVFYWWCERPFLSRNAKRTDATP